VLHRPAGRRALRVGGVEAQRGLVDLHTGRAGRRQSPDEIRVERQQGVEVLQRIHAGLGGLGEAQERVRAHDHGTGRQAHCPGLGKAGDGPGGVEREVHDGADLGHQVVVVGVEPLRHLERGGVGRAARQGELQLEAGPPAVGEPGRHRAQHEGGVEHVVVEGLVAAGHRVEARGGGPGQRLAAGGGAARLQLGAVDLPPPEGLQRELQFAVAADAGKAEHRRGRPSVGAHGFIAHAAPFMEPLS